MEKKKLLEKALLISDDAKRLVNLLDRYLHHEDRDLYHQIHGLSQKISTDLETWRYQFKKTFGRTR